jgi:Tfp pilus assembly protein PilF
MLRGNFDEAERFFLAALQRDPSYRGALGNLALLYERAGRRGEAIALYSAALKSLPSNVQIRNNFAAALAGGGRGRNTAAEARAIQELRKAAVLAPHPIIMRNLEVLEAP